MVGPLPSLPLPGPPVIAPWLPPIGLPVMVEPISRCSSSMRSTFALSSVRSGRWRPWQPRQRASSEPVPGRWPRAASAAPSTRRCPPDGDGLHAGRSTAGRGSCRKASKTSLVAATFAYRGPRPASSSGGTSLIPVCRRTLLTVRDEFVVLEQVIGDQQRPGPVHRGLRCRIAVHFPGVPGVEHPGAMPFQQRRRQTEQAGGGVVVIIPFCLVAVGTRLEIPFHFGSRVQRTSSWVRGSRQVQGAIWTDPSQSGGAEQTL